MVRREQHKRLHEWILSASNPRAPRGTGIGKLHKHANSPNFARSLCQVSTEESVLRSTPVSLQGGSGGVMLLILLPSGPSWLPCVPEQLPKTSLFWNQSPYTSWAKPQDAFQTTQASAATVCNQVPSSMHMSRRNNNFAAFWTAS